MATTGNIAGKVTNKTTGGPLAGVTVTVSGPALAERAEFTDSGGRYIITELPPGEYVVRFYHSTVRVEHPNVELRADQTKNVDAALPVAS